MSAPALPSQVLFQEYFPRLEEVLGGCDQLFQEMKARYPKELRCQRGCDDCCHQVLDLSLLEALYLNHAFHKAGRGLRRDIQRNAAKAEEKLKTIDIKRRGVIDIIQYQAQAAALDSLSTPCPLLKGGDCALYEHRPAMCRIFGLPLLKDSVATSCPKNGFVKGAEYPAIDFSAVRREIFQVEAEMAGPANPPASYRMLMVDALRLEIGSVKWDRLEDSFLAIVPTPSRSIPELPLRESSQKAP